MCFMLYRMDLWGHWHHPVLWKNDHHFILCILLEWTKLCVFIQFTPCNIKLIIPLLNSLFSLFTTDLANSYSTIRFKRKNLEIMTLCSQAQYTVLTHTHTIQCFVAHALKLDTLMPFANMKTNVLMKVFPWGVSMPAHPGWLLRMTLH